MKNLQRRRYFTLITCWNEGKIPKLRNWNSVFLFYTQIFRRKYSTLRNSPQSVPWIQFVQKLGRWTSPNASRPTIACPQHISNLKIATNFLNYKMNFYYLPRFSSKISNYMQTFLEKVLSMDYYKNQCNLRCVKNTVVLNRKLVFSRV